MNQSIGKNYTAEYSGNNKIVPFVRRTVTVMDKAFDFHAANGWEGQCDAAVRFHHVYLLNFGVCGNLFYYMQVF